VIVIDDAVAQTILERLTALEETTTTGLREVQDRLAQGADFFQIFQDGLAAHRERTIQGARQANAPIGGWTARIRADPDLRLPHRKILFSLLERYDFERQVFGELTFTALCQTARVGKNMLRSYLRLLIAKGYVRERDDGYRKHYSLADKPENAGHKSF
jgi:predicted transcriptional regulator